MTTNDAPYALGDYVAILVRRKVYLLTVIPAALLLAVYLAYSPPAQYRSTTTILLEPSSIPADLVQTTVTSYADQQIELTYRRLMTTENLEKLVQEVNPYPDSAELGSVAAKARQIVADTKIERVDPITLAILQQSNAFSIHYQNPDPRKATEVAQKIAHLFLEYNRQSRGERASGTYDFLLEQAKDIEVRTQEAEDKIAQFKARHGDALPERQARSLSAIDRLDREVQTLDAQIRGAQGRQGLLELQLGQLSPTLSGTGNPRAELATLQAQLADARSRYKPDHPDVRRLQRQIEAISAEAANNPAALSVVPDNPDYLAVQSQLQGVQREIAALHASAARARSQIRDFESRLSVAPAVEREYSELTRLRDVLLEQFRDVQGKLHEADVARSLEASQMGVRFAQIRPPSEPRTPFEPNRLGILLIGVVLGSGLAAAMVAAAESSDPSIRSARDLREVTAIPTLSAIPVIVSAADQRRQRLWWASYAGALAVGVAVVVLGITIAT